MPAVHADYAYRRSSKTGPGRRNGHRPRKTRPERAGRDQGTQLLTTRTQSQEEKERALLKLARAERGLLVLGKTAQKEYEIRGDSVAIQLNDMGLNNLEHDNLARAFRNFRAALDRDPELSIAHNNLGMLYLEIGEHERADQRLSNAVSLDEELNIAYSNRGLMRVELGECEKAYEDLERAIELDPGDPMHQGNMDVLFLETGEFMIALTCFTRAMELDPSNPMHPGNAGMAYQEMRDQDQANRAFMQAAELEREQFRAAVEKREHDRPAGRTAQGNHRQHRPRPDTDLPIPRRQLAGRTIAITTYHTPGQAGHAGRTERETEREGLHHQGIPGPEVRGRRTQAICPLVRDDTTQG